MTETRKPDERPSKGEALFDFCDVCVSRSADVGWLDVLANDKGQQAVQAIFADLPIKWTAIPKIAPPGWSMASINLPKMLDLCQRISWQRSS